MAGEPGSNSNASSAGRSGPTRVERIDRKMTSRSRRLTSLDAMEWEIHRQLVDLDTFAGELRERAEIKYASLSNYIFAGSGDSFACSLFAHYYSGGLSRPGDSYELQLYPEQVARKTVFIISVSGRTRANVRLARRVKNVARKRVAITASETSPLAKECDDLVLIPYKPPSVLTAGTLSFTLCLLATASRIKPLPLLDDLRKIEARAIRWARESSDPSGSRFIFVGSGIGYALSVYGAFKIHEVLGRTADYEHTEQLGHSRLFSLKKTDNVVCLATHGDEKTVEVCHTLSRNGFKPILLKCSARHPVLAGLEAAFSLQHLALDIARRTELSQCAFVEDQRRLRLSSQLIY